VPVQKSKKTLNINLLLEDEFGKTSFGKFIKWALSTGRYIVVFTELIVILAFLSRFKLDRDLTDLHELIEQKNAIVASAYELEKEIRSFQDGLLKINEVSQKQTSYSSFITSFAEIIPDEVTIESFSLEKNRLSLSCTSLTPQGIGLFIYQLKQSPKFSSISIENINRKISEPVKFNLTVNLTDKAFKD